MNNWLIVAVAILIAFFGAAILDRLPKPKGHKDFTFELPDEYVAFRIDCVIEDDFKVAFVDGWDIGRSFSLYGNVISDDNGKPYDAPMFGKRTGVTIGVISDWFESSRIGGMRVYDSGGCSISVALPFHIACALLEDVRRDPDQLVVIGFKRSVGKNGKPTFPVYGFELRKPMD